MIPSSSFRSPPLSPILVLPLTITPLSVGPRYSINYVNCKNLRCYLCIPAMQRAGFLWKCTFPGKKKMYNILLSQAASLHTATVPTFSLRIQRGPVSRLRFIRHIPSPFVRGPRYILLIRHIRWTGRKKSRFNNLTIKGHSRA